MTDKEIGRLRTVDRSSEGYPAPPEDPDSDHLGVAIFVATALFEGHRVVPRREMPGPDLADLMRLAADSDEWGVEWDRTVPRTVTSYEVFPEIPESFAASPTAEMRELLRFLARLAELEQPCTGFVIDSDFVPLWQKKKGQKSQYLRAQRERRTILLPEGSYIDSPSDTAYFEVRRTMYADQWEISETTGLPRSQIQRGQTEGIVEIVPSRDETRPIVSAESFDELLTTYRDLDKSIRADLEKNALEIQKKLSDTTGDVLDAALAIWSKNAKSPNEPVLIWYDDILKLRGLAQKKGGSGGTGGYRTHQREEVDKEFERIESLWTELFRVPSRGKRAVVVRGRPLVRINTVNQERLDGKPGDPMAAYILPARGIGDPLIGPGRRTAKLAANAINYKPRKHAYEKRLAKYLAWRWRMEYPDLIQTHKAATILEEVCLPLDMSRGRRTVDRLIKCLDRLQKDGYIATWQFTGQLPPDERSPDETVPRDWFRSWLSNGSILIEAPEDLRREYDRSKKLRAKAVPQIMQDTLGNRIRQRRVELGTAYGLSHPYAQAKVAEDVGINPTTLSHIECGKSRPHKSTRRKLESWLQKTKSEVAG